jgi:hypothetical protein
MTQDPNQNNNNDKLFAELQSDMKGLRRLAYSKKVKGMVGEKNAIPILQLAVQIRMLSKLDIIIQQCDYMVTKLMLEEEAEEEEIKRLKL